MPSIGQSVFISATTRGLGVWRDRIAEILDKHGIKPLYQADFTPESITVRREIRSLITKANGVVCLVGPYYGWPIFAEGVGEPPSVGEDNPSYTQYEWQLAMDWGKPIKTYLLADEFFADIESEESEKFDFSRSFRDWQLEFQQRVRDRGPYSTVRSELDLALALAKTNWERWMR